MEEYLALAKEIAEGASPIALKYFGFEIEETWKSNNTPLTQADTEINSFVIEKVNARYPDHSVLGEEESNLKPGSKYVWVCDPIDGTMPYSCGLPTFTFSLALVDQSDGQPIVAVVNDPVMKNMYWATKGGGAYRNGKRITVSKATDLKNTYMNIDGGSLIDPAHGSTKDSGTSKEKTITGLRRYGAKSMVLLSIVYGAIQVANGKFSGSIFFGKFAHDVAALKLITEEAGGKVTDIKGNDRRYDAEGFGCVVSNGILHDIILSCIQ